MKKKSYSEYRFSRIEGYGKVPIHWENRRLKNILSKKITDGPHETPEFISEGIPFLWFMVFKKENSFLKSVVLFRSMIIFNIRKRHLRGEEIC